MENDKIKITKEEMEQMYEIIDDKKEKSKEKKDVSNMGFDEYTELVDDIEIEELD